MSENGYPTGVFASEFTGSEFFLADHIIKERRILPAVVYLEMARAAVALSVDLGDQHLIVLTESLFILPMIVAGKCPVEVTVYPGASGEFGIEVRTDQGVHFQSKAHIQRRRGEAEEARQPEVLDIQAVEEQCATAGPDGREFYAYFRKKGIDLGPSLRGIQTIRFGRDCILVHAYLPGSSNLGMALNPGMFDSFIQSCDVLDNERERVRIPFAIARTEIYGSLTERMYGYTVKTERGLDVTIADEGGDIKVRISGFEGREIDSLQEQLVFYQPVWREEPGVVEENGARDTVSVIQDQTDYAGMVKSVFAIARKKIDEKANQHVIEVRLPEDKPAWRGIIALLKTITLENPKIICRLYQGDVALKLEYRAADLASTQAYRWPNDKTILITGGLGGLGMLLAQDIAGSSSGCTLILAGRRGLTGTASEDMRLLESLGARIIHAVCDVTREADVASLVAAYPEINGVIHASGIIRDSLIGKKTLEEIDEVLAPKVIGLEYLDKATAKLKLDYFITFSSIAGTLGNAGQADYAAANGYMDAYIRNRARQVGNGERYGKSISINWPLWDSAGMQLDQATKENMLQAMKMKPMPAARGLDALKRIISSDQRQLVVLYGNAKAVSSLMDKAADHSPQAKKRMAPVETSKLAREILEEVKAQTVKHLKLQTHQVDETADWATFGFDSILLAGFVNKFNAEFSLDLMPTVFFEATNILLFSQYLAENYPEQMAQKLSVAGEKQPGTPAAAPVEQEQLRISTFAQNLRRAHRSSVVYREKDIAIVGMSCRIAGARKPEEFWQMLEEGTDRITEIPGERWDWRDYPGVSKWGSFIDGVDEFDPLFFGISPAEAVYMSPEQRLMMQYVWECVEDAGYSVDELRGSNTGLFVGCGPSNYSYFLDALPVEAYTATGFVPSVGPNRISYLLDWHGPSNPVETACSSALVALHRAVEAIHAGHCDQAVAGGVNLLLNPDGYVSFSKAGMLCEDGKCKTFSDKANGYVRGEGIGMLMLKPLKAAVADGNSIYALVKGTAENHGGRTNSLTAPNPKSQAAVVKKAIREAEMDFSRVGYIECHGTGTPLGDPVEIEGLKMVAAELLKNNESVQSCKLGSIKSNIGHLEYGAGIVGLIKVLLQMKYKKIAKSLHCEKINPYIDLRNTPFVIAQSSSDWDVPPGKTRVAGVSSFGFGGVNAHVVLEEFPGIAGDATELQQERSPSPQLLVMSARTEESLISYVAQYPSYLRTVDDGPATLQRIAYTLQVGRAEMQERLVFIARTVKEWAEQIDAFLQEKGRVKTRRIYRGSVAVSSSSNLELGDTQAGREYLKQLIDAQETEKLAELWVKGTKIDWKMLHA